MNKPKIHPSAIVDPGAKIGSNVVIEPFAIVGKDVVIGNNCRIGPHSVVEFTEMGEGCQVFPFASIGLPPQHTRYKGEKTKVVTGKNCTFREGVTVHRGTLFDQGVTTIGDNGFFMAYSHIAHDCRIGNNVILANGALLAGHVEVGDNCFISASTGIHQFVRLGKCVMVSGGSMVPLDVAPFCIAQGDRAQIRGLNVVGMRRMGMPRESIDLVKNAYRALFFSGLPLEEALQQPAVQAKDDFVVTFRDFFSKKKRGFTRPSSETDQIDGEESFQ